MRIAGEYPSLPVWPVCADFNQALELPNHGIDEHPPLIFFPGSTIGNFDEETRSLLLLRMAELCSSHGQTPDGGRLLIGIDLIKDAQRLEAAYNDASGVTAEFNLNLLARFNRELGANFAVDRFSHRAVFNLEASRVEMRLKSTHRQQIEIDGETFAFEPGEEICTEHSYKFNIESFGALAERSGWKLEKSWTDDEELFGVLLLRTL